MFLVFLARQGGGAVGQGHIPAPSSLTTLWTGNVDGTSYRRSPHSKTHSPDLSRDNSGRPLARTRVSSGDFGTGRPSLSNGVTPLNTKNTATSGKSSAFGLGSGAFASFGSASKTPKTPGSAFDWGKTSVNPPTPATDAERATKTPGRASSISHHDRRTQLDKLEEPEGEMPLKSAWVMWYRPPAAKNSDYEKSIKPVYRVAAAQDFWRVYAHLKRPSALPTVSDYHFFKDGIRPVWEDEQNKRGGKWIMRLKKGVIDRYWEELLLTTIGDQFLEAGEEVCGMVVSVRSGEDVISIWTKMDGGRNVKIRFVHLRVSSYYVRLTWIRETVKRVLDLPADTNIVWKSHDDSIAQRSAIDQARQEKGNAEKRRNTLTLNESGNFGKEKPLT
ncbi:MAG: hypothetical protein Q9162_004368 [Coniocarpon cinnabarinum]